MEANVCLSVLNTELKAMIKRSEYSKRNRQCKCIIIPFEIDNINLQIALTAFCNIKTKTDGTLSHYIQYRGYKIYPSTKSKTISDLKKAIMKTKQDTQV